MAMPVELETLAFDPADPKAALNQLPTSSAVFALYGAEAHAEPYIASCSRRKSIRAACSWPGACGRFAGG
jgi:hypothetical protein